MTCCYAISRLQFRYSAIAALLTILLINACWLSLDQPN